MNVKVHSSPWSAADVFLSTDHAASSYGLPVLVCNGQAYGPADPLPNGKLAAEFIVACAGGWRSDDERLEEAKKFLSQWPVGPQLA